LKGWAGTRATTAAPFEHRIERSSRSYGPIAKLQESPLHIAHGEQARTPGNPRVTPSQLSKARLPVVEPKQGSICWSVRPAAAAGSMKPRPVLSVEQVAIAGVEAERYRAARLQRRTRPHLGDEPIAGGAVEMHQRGVAERLGELHRTLERGAVAQDDMLGPHPEHSPA